MNYVYFILFGLVIGIIARFLMPGQQSMGMIMTAILGMAGSILGGWLSTTIRGVPPTDVYNWIGAILGTVLLIFLYGMLTKRSA